MIFGTPKTWNPDRWKPLYTHILRVYWSENFTFDEIAAKVGCSTQLVSNVVNSDQGKVILKQLDDKTFDSMLDVITAAQAVSMEMFNEKVKLALHSADEKIRTRNTTDLLAIAGHTPLHRVSVERPDAILNSYKDQTPEQLRQALLKLKDSTPVVNGVGPDGKLVN